MNLPEQYPMEGKLSSPSTVPFDPQMLQVTDWETLNSLAYKYHGESESSIEPLQLAMGDGISFQTKRALLELDRSESGPKAQTAAPWGGKDDKLIQEYKARVKPQQDEQKIKALMRLRGWTREQAEKAAAQG